MSTKIDLEDLARQVRAGSMGPWQRGVDCSLALALIMRILELEAALFQAGHVFFGSQQPPSAMELIALLEKVVVLP